MLQRSSNLLVEECTCVTFSALKWLLNESLIVFFNICCHGPVSCLNLSHYLLFIDLSEFFTDLTRLTLFFTAGIICIFASICAGRFLFLKELNTETFFRHSFWHSFFLRTFFRLSRSKSFLVFAFSAFQVHLQFSSGTRLCRQKVCPHRRCYSVITAISQMLCLPIVASQSPSVHIARPMDRSTGVWGKPTAGRTKVKTDGQRRKDRTTRSREATQPTIIRTRDELITPVNRFLLRVAGTVFAGC